MDIHISRKGEQFGPYPEAVARQYLQDGTLAATDLAWHAGADGWKPLGELLGIAAQPPAEPTPPPEPQPPPEPEPTPPPSPATSGPPPATPASSGLPATPSTSGPPPSTPAGDSAAAAASDADEIHIKRKGQQVVTMKRPKAMENFTAGKLVPTDWGWHDGMDEWKPLWEVLDAGAGVAAGAGASTTPTGTGGAWTIGGCLSEGWQAFKGNLGGAIIFTLLSLIVLSIASLPLLNLFLLGPLTAGLLFFFIKQGRREHTSIGILFSGFKRGYLQLLLLSVLMALIMVVAMLPGIITVVVSAAPLIKEVGDFMSALKSGSVTSFSQITSGLEDIMSALKLAGVGFLIGMILIGLIPPIVLTYFCFALPLAIDRQMKAVDALKASARVVKGQWFKLFAFLILVQIISQLGVILLGIGILFTIPIGLSAFASCYLRNVK
jgi:uncharacterized membrane protein